MRKDDNSTPPKLNTRVFRTLTDVANFAEKDGKNQSCARESDGFCGGTLEKSIRLTRDGDLSCVEPSNKLLSQFEKLAYQTVKRRWQDDIVGSTPNVQAFLAGSPMSMRRRVKVQSNFGVIRVILDLFASCAFSHEDIRKRGAAVLALTRILAMRRPVELYIGSSSKDYAAHQRTMWFARINTAPLDLAHAAFVMTDPLFLRRVGFVTKEAIGGESPFYPLDDGELAKLAHSAFGPCQTVLVPGIVSSGADVVADPQKWIIDRIKEAAPEMLRD